MQSVEHLGSKVETTERGVKVVQPQVAMLVIRASSVGGLLFETSGHIEDDLSEDRVRTYINTSHFAPTHIYSTLYIYSHN